MNIHKRLKLVFESYKDVSNPQKFLESLINNKNEFILAMMQIATDDYTLGTGYNLNTEGYDISRPYDAKELALDIMQDFRTVLSFSGNISNKNNYYEIISIEECYDSEHDIMERLDIDASEYVVLGEADFAYLVDKWKGDEEFREEVNEIIDSSEEWAVNYADMLDPYLF